MTGNQTQRPNNLHDCSFIIIRNASLRSLHCGTDHPQDCKIARLPGESWMHLAGDAMPCRTNHPQDCKIARLPEESWMHLAGDGTRRSSSVSGVVHDPQDALKHLPRNLAILHSCGWYASTGTFGCLHDDTQSLHIQRRRRIANSTLRSECNSSARKALRIPNSVLRHPTCSNVQWLTENLVF